MTGRKRKMSLGIVLSIVLGLLLAAGAYAAGASKAEVPRITKEELKALIGSPDVIIIDDRSGSDWSGSEFKIKGAIREDPGKASDWMSKYPKDKTLVFYCA